MAQLARPADKPRKDAGARRKVFWTAPRHEDRLLASEPVKLKADESHDTPAEAFFWINLAQRRAPLS